jgi:hypothetical protein
MLVAPYEACMIRATCVLALGLVSCSGNPLPGSPLGTYKVVAKQTANTCGLGAPDPWIFSVQLSRKDSTLYWSWMDGSPMMSGPLDAQAQATLRTSRTGNVDGSDAGALGPCTLKREDDLEILLGQGDPPSAFSGTVGYSFSVPSGSDCRDQLSSAGGPYQALPCTVSYRATATQR